MSPGSHKTDPGREWTNLWAQLFIINNSMVPRVKQKNCLWWRLLYPCNGSCFLLLTSHSRSTKLCKDTDTL